jgi:hypothetical protein
MIVQFHSIRPIFPQRRFPPNPPLQRQRRLLPFACGASFYPCQPQAFRSL